MDQISTRSPWKGPHTRACGCLKEAVTLWGAHAGAGSCQESADPWREEPKPEQVCWQSLGPHGDPHWSSLFLEDCTPWEGPTLGQSVKSCSPWEGLMLEKFVENCLL